MAVRAIFRNMDGVSISERADGIIRIVIERVPKAILDTRFPSLRSIDQQYTEEMAIWAITDSGDVSRAEKRSTAYRWAYRAHFFRDRTGGERLPRLPEVLN